MHVSALLMLACTHRAAEQIPVRWGPFNRLISQKSPIVLQEGKAYCYMQQQDLRENTLSGKIVHLKSHASSCLLHS